MLIIGPEKLVLVLLPALLVVWIYWKWNADAKTPLYAIARMLGQLIVIGYLLTYIFESDHWWLISGVLTIMLLVSAWISLRPIPTQRLQLYSKALLSTAAINLLLLALITQVILESDPWFQPNIVIPLAGMIFACGMNAISLFAERFYAEIDSHSDEILARNCAYRATLIPTINSLFAVGIVSLPGMMTGQILSGVSPLIAVRYQIMIMLMLLISSGLTPALFYKLMRR